MWVLVSGAEHVVTPGVAPGLTSLECQGGVDRIVGVCYPTRWATHENAFRAVAPKHATNYKGWCMSSIFKGLLFPWDRSFLSMISLYLSIIKILFPQSFSFWVKQRAGSYHQQFDIAMVLLLCLPFGEICSLSWSCTFIKFTLRSMVLKQDNDNSCDSLAAITTWKVSFLNNLFNFSWCML